MDKSCHSSQSSYLTGKNTIYVEANVINMYAKYQLYPPCGFREEDFFYIFSKIYPFCHPGNQSNSVFWTKII